ncbi:hypothetical protein LSPH24S_09423 [Lysinibacillus sphaericus]
MAGGHWFYFLPRANRRSHRVSAGLTQLKLGGMPLFFVIAFMNAFMMTVIYEEIFFRKERAKNVSQ